ncbi:hypothetical protein NDK47_03055 [Brevibacillus ruminantium]|uniref:Lipoprotein n=1 Tax=Brevibacillus ruminantium TaxID=2950604 RepID=A0ABY4WKD5_9BACL|nr:hypothetical protein [Brevibacillus ruminantium]USG66325.1 hypothetical protein NDK47_03055 [Brevibacillus ruminantium]
MIKKQLLWLVVCLLLIGCNKETANELSLDTVVQAFSSNNVQLEKAEYDGDYFRLHRQTPSKYVLNGNVLFIYTFATPEDAQQGLNDFFTQTEQLNIVIPKIFQARNALLFYLTSEPRTDPFLQRDLDILAVVTSLNEDIQG